ncbi:glycosyltransferase family 4 protein [Alteromonas gilva]|uniref:Glycosyltransferase family 4 protein n=1 Tax=Alteromonas gilva TaxID=2987522 RepID=A0ABT5L7H4_9ALTE|nr:glycosyltransferase family 4 protein [Alteromonas gilva]MDC8833015.1 glycosyltransferase family 4 protein [Alteromonas gilva]
MKKILFISHGHPELSKGGAEVASWNLYQQLKEQGFECLYIARTDPGSHGGSTFSVRGEELLFHTAMDDWFSLSTKRLKPLFDDLGDLVKEYAPDVIHIHHYAHMGFEIFAALRQAAPNAKIVFTIHEFMTICMHNGQMVKKGSLKLCHKALPADCHKCFPQHSPGDFLLRQQYLLDQFDNVDCFVSPSHFLAKRYIEWGLPEDKMHVIENVLPEMTSFPPAPIKEGEKRTRLAFFGQINPYKGLDILLNALTLLPDNIREQITLDVHGANLDKQEPSFQEKINKQLDALSDCVNLRGAYESEQLPGLLADCDWVVIPSIWWENSPVVIQEAIAHGRPLIGSNIGGMKEKIENIAGLTFEARSASSLAKTIQNAIEPDVFEHWQKSLVVSSNTLQEHISLLNSL